MLDPFHQGFLTGIVTINLHEFFNTNVNTAYGPQGTTDALSARVQNCLKYNDREV